MVDTKRKNSHSCRPVAGPGSSRRPLGSAVPACCRRRRRLARQGLERSRDRCQVRGHRQDDREGYPLAAREIGLPGRLVVGVPRLHRSPSRRPSTSRASDCSAPEDVVELELQPFKEVRPQGVPATEGLGEFEPPVPLPMHGDGLADRIDDPVLGHAVSAVQVVLVAQVPVDCRRSATSRYPAG